MKTTKFLALLAIVAIFAACKSGEDTPDEPTTDVETTTGDAYTVDVTNSGIHFVASAPEDAYHHHGMFSLNSGSVEVTDGNISGGTIEINLASLTIMDDPMEEEKRGKLTGHLLSPDFFGAEEMSTATLTINSATPFEGEWNPDPAHEAVMTLMADEMFAQPSHMVSGTLNVKGQDQPVDMLALVDMNDATISAKVMMKMDRTEMGLRFQSDAEAKAAPTVYVTASLSAAK